MRVAIFVARLMLGSVSAIVSAQETANQEATTKTLEKRVVTLEKQVQRLLADRNVDATADYSMAPIIKRDESGWVMEAEDTSRIH